MRKIDERVQRLHKTPQDLAFSQTSHSLVSPLGFPYASAASANLHPSALGTRLQVKLGPNETQWDIYLYTHSIAVAERICASAIIPDQVTHISLGRRQYRHSCSAYCTKPTRHARCQDNGVVWATSRAGPDMNAQSIIVIDALCRKHAAQILEVGGMYDHCLLSHLQRPGMNITLWDPTNGLGGTSILWSKDKSSWEPTCGSQIDRYRCIGSCCPTSDPSEPVWCRLSA
jgi:hypothetical protein